jgi:hypothetical protein
MLAVGSGVGGDGNKGWEQRKLSKGGDSCGHRQEGAHGMEHLKKWDEYVIINHLL